MNTQTMFGINKIKYIDFGCLGSVLYDNKMFEQTIYNISPKVNKLYFKDSCQ